MKAYADTRIGESVFHVVGSHGEEALETGRARSWDTLRPPEKSVRTCPTAGSSFDPTVVTNDHCAPQCLRRNGPVAELSHL